MIASGALRPARIALLLLAMLCVAPATTATTNVSSRGRTDRLNVIVIVADDLGFSDLGFLGSEIATPNLDALAHRGVTLTQFRVSPACSTTRAMLLTGIDHHRAGFGTMREMLASNQFSKPGYETHLSRNVATVAEILRQAGYRTYMAGKWHLGFLPEDDPASRGFDRSFAMLHWGSGNFSGERSRVPAHVPSRIGEIPFRNGEHDFTENGVPLNNLPQNFFTSDAYVDQIIRDIHEGPRGQPFFAYLAFNAPHVPIQAPSDWIDRYVGQYQAGPATVRAQRIARARERGTIPNDSPASTMRPGTDAWNALPADERRVLTRVQEVYAAMVSHMDAAIGRLVASLERDGIANRTVILFLSDNGAAANETSPGSWYTRWIEENFDNSLANIGKRNSEKGPGRFWAQVGSSPFRGWKLSTYEGGIRVPLIVAGPGIGRRLPLAAAPAHALDIVPTVLDFARVDINHAPRVAGRSFEPTGVSLRPYLAGQTTRAHPPDTAFGFELDGARAMQVGRWKVVRVAPPRGTGEWELYDLARDPGETSDLARSKPAVLARLVQRWEVYARDNGIITPDKRLIDW